MSRTTTPRTRKPKGRRQPTRPWIRLWPIVAGFLIAPVAIHFASVLALSGPGALRLLYPWVVVVQNEASHLSVDQVERFPQWILYWQFPAYGIFCYLMSQVFVRSAGLFGVLLLHIAGIAAAIFTTSVSVYQ